MTKQQKLYKKMMKLLNDNNKTKPKKKLQEVDIVKLHGRF
jgi:hypothetical protein